MKTNHIFTRKMTDFNENQGTSDGMINATALEKQWYEFVKSQNSNLHTQNFGYVKKTNKNN